MIVEETWANAGRDMITIGELIEFAEMGYEFVLAGGHIVSALLKIPEEEAA